jgi:hypothetical protein
LIKNTVNEEIGSFLASLRIAEVTSCAILAQNSLLYIAISYQPPLRQNYSSTLCRFVLALSVVIAWNNLS